MMHQFWFFNERDESEFQVKYLLKASYFFSLVLLDMFAEYTSIIKGLANCFLNLALLLNPTVMGFMVQDHVSLNQTISLAQFLWVLFVQLIVNVFSWILIWSICSEPIIVEPVLLISESVQHLQYGHILFLWIWRASRMGCT